MKIFRWERPIFMADLCLYLKGILSGAPLSVFREEKLEEAEVIWKGNGSRMMDIWEREREKRLSLSPLYFSVDTKRLPRVLDSELDS